MGLTARQRDFLVKLQEVYHQTGEPVHYADLARAVGVSPFSAYDMLRLLERKGAVVSDYALPPTPAGPGRPRVVFRPTGRAEGLLRAYTLPRPRWGDWQQFQEQMIEQLQGLGEADGLQVAQRLLEDLSRRRSPLHYCAESLTALLASLDHVQERAVGLLPMQALRSLVASGEEVLSLAMGLGLGSLLSHAEFDHDLKEKLLATARHYQQQLAHLNDEARGSLSDFLRQAVQVVAADAQTAPENP